MLAGGGRPADMPRPYSQDLRDRVVASVAGGRSRRATAKMFSVSVGTVVRWSQRFRMTGSAAALAMGGRRPHRLAGRRDWLLARVAGHADLSLFAGRAGGRAPGAGGAPRPPVRPGSRAGLRAGMAKKPDLSLWAIRPERAAD